MKLRILTGSMAAFSLNGIFFAADTATATGGENSTEATAAPVLTADEFLAAHPIVETTTIELKKLVIDAGTQPRVAIDNEVRQEYAETIKAAVKNEQPNPFGMLPPEKLPQVFRDPTGRCVLADGFHRYGGHKDAHVKEMVVAIRNGDERDALRFSLGTNQDHGVRRTTKDKQRALKTIFHDSEWAGMPNTEIGRTVGVSEAMVRQHRPAAKSPAARTVTIRGKKTTMNTSAIGKGKGGGKKGAKSKAAKKSGKKGAAAAPAGTAGTSKDDAAAELDKQLMKIAQAVGGTEGGKIRAAVLDGSLELSAREVRDWSNFGEKDIKNVAPLVTGGARMKPTKAFDFLKSELSSKIVEELHNRALGGGGKYEFEADGIKIVVTHVGK